MPSNIIAPRNAYERDLVMIEHARELAAEMQRTGQHKAYYAGRERTADEWLAFANYHERRLNQ